jgi:hypothetical protein
VLTPSGRDLEAQRFIARAIQFYERKGGIVLAERARQHLGP